MKRLFLLCVLLAALSACATTKMSSTERLALYREHAAAPVKDFSYFGSLNGWQPLGDSALAVWTKPNEAYLLDLAGPCQDLEFVPTITISSMMGRVTNFDRVRPLGGGSGVMRMSCRIKTISPLDLKSLKAAEKEMREAKIEARQEGEPAN